MSDIDTQEEVQEEEIQEEPQEESQEESQEEPQEIESTLTDKGTKLDPNPLSAVHQELANERRRNAELMNVLAKLTSKEKSEEEEEFPFEKLETAEDVVNAFKTIYGELRGTKSLASELREQLVKLSEASAMSQAASQLEGEVSEVRGKYPELDPKSDQYIPELEKKVSELYQRVNFDGDRFLGRVSLSDISDMVMSAASKAKKIGAEEAQTRVIEKKRGAILTSAQKQPKKKPEAVEEILGERIKNMFKGGA